MTRLEQIMNLARRQNIKPEAIDDFIWTFTVRLILNQADEYFFNKTMSEYRRDYEKEQENG